MRVRHVSSIDELIHADGRVVVAEYRSATSAAPHEFRDDAERWHYARLVHAWGMFAHEAHFTAAITTTGTVPPIPADPSAHVPMAEAVAPVCRDCGGDSLVRDASARWDIGTQGWSISGAYDSTYCDDCESESDDLCRWRPVTPAVPVPPSDIAATP